MRRPVSLPLLAFGEPDQGYATARVTSPFGWRPNPLYPAASRIARTFHDGLDIGNGRSGDEVVAAEAGVVIAEGFLREPWSQAAPAGSGWVGGNYGGAMVVIDTGEGRVLVYAHMDRTVVDRGNRMAAGDVIGYIGATGSATLGGAHLHFTVQVAGQPVDPWPLIVAGAETREERLAREALSRRAQLPLTYAQLVAWTGFTQDLDGQPLTRETRLAVESLLERIAAVLGDEAAAEAMRQALP